MDIFVGDIETNTEIGMEEDVDVVDASWDEVANDPNMESGWEIAAGGATSVIPKAGFFSIVYK